MGFSEAPLFAIVPVNASPTILSLLAYCVYVSSIAIYRLVFHPLSRFPGPKLAAVTSWYGAFYNILQNGRLSEHLVELHKIYGPVIRIGPNELHFNGFEAFSKIHASGSKFTKDADWYRRVLDLPQSSIGFVDPQLAKTRRDVLSGLFSRGAIVRLETLVQEKVDKLISNLSAHVGSSDRVDLHRAYRCVSIDIITSYAFAQSMNTLDHKDFLAPLLDGIDAGVSLLWIFERFPWLKKIVYAMPTSLLPPGPRVLMVWSERIGMQVDAIIADPAALDRDVSHEVIYQRLYALHPSKGQHELPSRQSLFEEAQVMITAGSDTTANVCFVATFHVLQNPDMRERLTRELVAAWPDASTPISFRVLEKLPYLTAVLKEGLRLEGIVSPLRRRTPCDVDLAGYHVPAGTTVSTGSHFLHLNEDFFADPLRFDPDRWLASDSRQLDKYFVPFSKGPRICLGINLAWCELYLIIGNVFRKMNLELDDPSIKQLESRDFAAARYVGPKVLVEVVSGHGRHSDADIVSWPVNEVESA